MAIQVSNSPSTSATDYPAPSCSVRGSASGELFQPDGYSLWRVAGSLDPGAELQWTAEHGDEALFVLTGSLDVDGHRAGAESAVIIEAGVPTSVQAIAATRLLHFGPVSAEPPSDGLFGPPTSEGRSAHVVPLDETERIETAGGTSAHFFTDGTCRKCRIAFFIIDGRDLNEGQSAMSHSHSEDEIIHVLDGRLQIGRTAVDAGCSVAIPADVRYGFRAPGPYRFVNYRRDVSTVTFGTTSRPRVFLETADEIRRLAETMSDFS